MYSPVKILLFDLDGTILDTESIFFKAYEELLGRYKKPFPLELQLKCLGKCRFDLHDLLIKDLGLKDKTVDELAAEGAAIQERMYETESIKLMPGVRKLVLHMAEHCIPMGIATAAPGCHVWDIIKYHPAFFQLFDHIVCGDNACHSKPYPDIFLLTAKRFQDPFNPKDFLVFEDTPGGVEAGLRAGMQVVMIPHPLIPEEETRKATKVLSSLEDFVPEEFGLPSYQEK